MDACALLLNLELDDVTENTDMASLKLCMDVENTAKNAAPKPGPFRLVCQAVRGSPYWMTKVKNIAQVYERLTEHVPSIIKLLKDTAMMEPSPTRSTAEKLQANIQKCQYYNAVCFSNAAGQLKRRTVMLAIDGANKLLGPTPLESSTALVTDYISMFRTIDKIFPGEQEVSNKLKELIRALGAMDK